MPLSACPGNRSLASDRRPAGTTGNLWTTLLEFTARFFQSGINFCSVFTEYQQAVIGRQPDLLLQLHLLAKSQRLERLQITDTLGGVARPQAAVKLLVTGRGKLPTLVEGSIKAEYAAG